MPEAVATLAPSGAGRLEDWIWPGRLTAGGGGAYDTSCTNRNGSASASGSTAGIGVATTNIADVRLGVPCVMHRATAAGGNSLKFYGPMGIWLRTSRSNINHAVDDSQVYRVIWTFCGAGIAPGANQDFGLQIAQIVGTTGRIVVDANNGFGFRINSAAQLQWIVRGPNGLVTVNFAVDTTVWHTLDMRIRSSTATEDAGLEVKLDGATLNLGALNTSWAAGTNLPASLLQGGLAGWAVNLPCNTGNVNNYWTYQLRRIAAPSVMATL